MLTSALVVAGCVAHYDMLTGAIEMLDLQVLIRFQKEPDCPLNLVSRSSGADASFSSAANRLGRANTKKEGVSRTYKGFDGYSPFFAYLGQEGYCVNTELREGKTHVQKNADDFIDMSIRYAPRVTDTPLLLRLDGGNDAADNINLCLDQEGRFPCEAQSSHGIAKKVARACEKGRPQNGSTGSIFRNICGYGFCFELFIFGSKTKSSKQNGFLFEERESEH